jgi:phosphoglycerate dehydrogenase-like enzyme
MATFNNMDTSVEIAVLDDYQKVAMLYADWSVIQQKAKVTIFNDHLDDEQQLIDRLQSFQVICIMRERTPLKRSLLSSLPNLKLIVSTGRVNASLDLEACKELGIEVKMTGYVDSGAPELTWALLMAIARHLPTENNNVRKSGWQTTVGVDLKNKTLGIVGLGRIGTKVARYARAFDMQVIAWSEHLTKEKAEAAGATWVSKEDLFQQADFVSVHLVLSNRSRNTIGATELALMKPTAYLINTSRGPIVNEAELIEVLSNRRIAGAALDVYDSEPLPNDHPFRKLDNVLATPHIGYVTEDTYRVFYNDTVRVIEEWLG